MMQLEEVNKRMIDRVRPLNKYTANVESIDDIVSYKFPVTRGIHENVAFQIINDKEVFSSGQIYLLSKFLIMILWIIERKGASCESIYTGR